MKVFITGGTGFIGSHLIEKLIERNNVEIFALVRNLHQLKWLDGLRINFLHGDLFSIPELPRDLDYVFHLAGITKTLSLADYYTVNQMGTASLLQALHSQDVRPKRFLHLSSLAAGRPSMEGKPVIENQPPHPVTRYGHSKLLAEYEVLRHQESFSVATFRVGPVYGPKDTDFVPYFKSIKRGILPSFGRNHGSTSLCYVKDLVAALCLGMEKNIQSGEVFNIADPEHYTWDDIGLTAARIMEKKTVKIKIPFPVIRLASLVSEVVSQVRRKPHILDREKIKEIHAMKEWGWLADTQKARDFLGFNTAFSLEQGLKETLSWYTAHKWL
jgi:nucleoside-diphosphate-sugar epimerase